MQVEWKREQTHELNRPEHVSEHEYFHIENSVFGSLMSYLFVLNHKYHVIWRLDAHVPVQGGSQSS